jgi:uncharacterized membrane protein YvbJ
MFCKNCGKEVPENMDACPECGPVVNAEQAAKPAPPKTYLAQAIIVTILCCWPLGIPAIIFAAQVNSKYAVGDYAGAAESSRKASMWSWISFSAGLVIILLYILAQALGVFAAAAAANGAN